MRHVPCQHWRDCGLIDGGCCAIKAFDKPSVGVCLRLCPRYAGPPRGLGDAVHQLIHRATAGRIKPCGRCAARRRLLNQLIPYHGENNDGNASLER